jgi:hypothetical protein
MALPDFDQGTGYLPGGDHDATLQEVRDRFGYNHRRREILTGLEHVLGLLAQKGVTTIWLDGSFVTDKMRPSDVEVIYLPPPNEDPSTWPDHEWISPKRRGDCKIHHRVDLWHYPSYQISKKKPIPGPPITIKEYFATDRDDRPKGLVHLTRLDADDS